jgi:hypothetical protein
MAAFMPGASPPEVIIAIFFKFMKESLLTYEVKYVNGGGKTAAPQASKAHYNIKCARPQEKKQPTTARYCKNFLEKCILTIDMPWETWYNSCV